MGKESVQQAGSEPLAVFGVSGLSFSIEALDCVMQFDAANKLWSSGSQRHWEVVVDIYVASELLDSLPDILWRFVCAAWSIKFFYFVLFLTYNFFIFVLLYNSNILILWCSRII